VPEPLLSGDLDDAVLVEAEDVTPRQAGDQTCRPCTTDVADCTAATVALLMATFDAVSQQADQQRM